MVAVILRFWLVEPDPDTLRPRVAGRGSPGRPGMHPRQGRTGGRWTADRMRKRLDSSAGVATLFALVLTAGCGTPDTYFEPIPGVEIQTYELEEYLRQTAAVGAVGPVPVLYTDLLRGR